eukprot:TRINITY_DN26599_c0_g1_i1.p1 TRINITY_DN26599_c0_g1~~TRINITY_DN26599_c0_g1_i1.p1  ORF type:complete len:454 (-),score=62.51 TRINITY_DN26599_c0_g1_i1:77-1396(-)
MVAQTNVEIINPNDVHIFRPSLARADDTQNLTMKMNYASARGDVAELSKLLESRADVNASDYDERTPLHLAVSRNEFAAAEFLLQQGAEPNVLDYFGQTPIYDAQRAGNYALEELLKKHGAQLQSHRLQVLGSREKWALQRSTVDLEKKLSETIKSDVFTASWRGMKVVAKLAKPNPNIGLHGMDEEELESVRKELLHEIDILSTMRHPDLVLFLGACLDEPVMFLTEFMPGGDLERYYMHKRNETQQIWRPKLAQLLRWAGDVARALCFLHCCEPPLVHRDLKPLNLLLNEDYTRLKVSDFGMSVMKRTKNPFDASKTGEHYKMTGGVGSLRYMAPEVVRYERYNEKVDIYSFALILYFMSAGRDPFFERGPDPEVVLKEYIKGQEPRPTVEHCHAALRPLMTQAWHVKPTERPSAYELTGWLTSLNGRGMQCACNIS